MDFVLKILEIGNALLNIFEKVFDVVHMASFKLFRVSLVQFECRSPVITTSSDGFRH